MGQDKTKLAYHSRHSTIRLLFQPQGFHDPAHEPPEHYLDKAKQKFKSLVSSGDLIGVEIYAKKLKNAWATIRASKDQSQDMKAIVIGQGIPPLKGLKVTASDDPAIAARIDLNGPQESVAAWTPGMALAFIHLKLKESGSKKRVSRNAVKEMLDEFLHGHTVEYHALPVAGLAPNPPKDAPYPGKGMLKIAISEDKMTATVMEWPENASDGEVPFNDSWLQRELRRLQISPDAEVYTDQILAKLTKKISIEGEVLARGFEGRIKGQATFTRLTSAPISPSPTPHQLGPSLADIVKEGDLVAQRTVADDDLPAMDIYGHQFTPRKAPSSAKIKVGSGIEERSEGQFYATTSGILRLTNRGIAVDPAFRYIGNISGATGPLIYDGNAVIQGNIEPGAQVFIGKNLEVQGAIAGGQIKVSGDLKVTQGIISGDRGFVHCEGDIKARYLEKADIKCEGDLKVFKAIMNCRILVKGSIKVYEKTGLTAGGTIRSVGGIKTPNLGFPNSRTKVNVGIDWDVEQKIHTNEHRLGNLKDTLEKSRQRQEALGETARLSGAWAEEFANLPERIQRLEKLVKATALRLRKLARTAMYDAEAKMVISNILLKNCDIQMAGHEIEVLRDYRAVQVLGRPRAGNHIVNSKDVSLAEESFNE